jgi:hypothetical protein
MNPELVKFHLPTTDQFSVAVDRLKFPAQSEMWLCHESIYQAAISRDRHCCGHLGWLPTIVPRCAPGEITGALIGAPNGARRGLSIRCSPSTNGPSRPRTGPNRGTGRRPHHRQGPALGDRHAPGTADQNGPAAAPSSAKRRHPARHTEGADGQPARSLAEVDHLGPGNRNGPPPHDR